MGNDSAIRGAGQVGALEQEGAVGRENLRLGESIDMLEDVLKTLANNLQPILKNNPSADKAREIEPKDVPSVQSEIASSLEKHGRKVQFLRVMVMDLISNIDL